MTALDESNLIARAQLLRREGSLLEAAELYREAANVEPDAEKLRFESRACRYDAARRYRQSGALDRAEALLRGLALEDPASRSIANELGLVLIGRGSEDAVPYFRRLLAMGPETVDVLTNLGVALNESGAYLEAVGVVRRALELAPQSADLLTNLANAYRWSGQTDRAIATYDQALTHDAEHVAAHVGRSCTILLSGQYARGWPEYEWRLKLFPPLFDGPVWDGRPVRAGPLVVYAEQGLGDTIQFARYLPRLKGFAEEVQFVCPPRMHELLSGLDSSVTLLGERPTIFGAHIPLLSLPSIFKTAADALPPAIPYLAPRPDLTRRWRGHVGHPGAFRIGIAWQGSRKKSGDRQRSVALSCFESLSRIPGVALVSFQVGEGIEQLRGVPFEVQDVGGVIDQDTGAFVETAAALQEIDLVVSVDSSLVHVAGTLGIPTWVLLQKTPCWRWLTEGSTTGWYSSVELFRQEEAGDWAAVLARVAGRVAECVRERAS